MRLSISSIARTSALVKPCSISFTISTAATRILGNAFFPSGVSSSFTARRSSAERTRRTRPRASSASILRVMAPGSWARMEQTVEAVSAMSFAMVASTT